MSFTPAGSITKADATAAPATSVRKLPSSGKGLNEALEEFEAMFASAMLRTAREGSGGGWLGGESSGGSDGIMEFAEQNIGRAIASKGAFGIAKALGKSISDQSSLEQPIAKGAGN